MKTVKVNLYGTEFTIETYCYECNGWTQTIQSFEECNCAVCGCEK